MCIRDSVCQFLLNGLRMRLISVIQETDAVRERAGFFSQGTNPVLQTRIGLKIAVTVSEELSKAKGKLSFERLGIPGQQKRGHRVGKANRP